MCVYIHAKIKRPWIWKGKTQELGEEQKWYKYSTHINISEKHLKKLVIVVINLKTKEVRNNNQIASSKYVSFKHGSKASILS